MADTFLISTTIAAAVPSVEVLAYPGPPYYEHVAMLALFNSIGSYRNLSIKRIEVYEQGGRTTTAQVRLLTTRVTALTGGEAITVTKMDQNQTAFPALVSVVQAPTTITTTGDPIRSDNIVHSFSPTVALRGLATSLSGSFDRNTITCRDTNVQAHTLREGQGIAVTSSAALMSGFVLEVLVYLNVGTDTFFFSEVIFPSSERPLFAILNGTGSGVVVTIARLQIRQIRTDDAIRLVSVERISAISGGDDVAATSFDSANSALTSGVKIRRNAAVTQAGPDALQLSTATQCGGDLPFRRVVLPYFGKSPGLASGLLALQTAPQAVFNSPPSAVDADGGIMLREGQGIGVFQRVNACGRGNYEVAALFTATVTGSGGGGGETSHVF